MPIADRLQISWNTETEFFATIDPDVISGLNQQLLRVSGSRSGKSINRRPTTLHPPRSFFRRRLRSCVQPSITIIQSPCS